MQLLDIRSRDDCAISINPATDEEIARFPLDDRAQQDEILRRADVAQRQWACRPIGERTRMLAQLAVILRGQAPRLAALITSEMGKPISAARAEVAKCADLCDWYAAHSAKLLAAEHPDLGGDGEAEIAYVPLGAVLGVMPWNFPLWQVLRAAVPILAAGNGFVLKHADNVQGCAAALADLFAAADSPSGLFGVLNIERGAMAHVIADRRIAAVTVTAGITAGAAIAAQAGAHLKKSLLELGGSDAFIVLADADIDRAVAAAIQARFRNTGQVCIAAKRFIVERPIAQAFIDRFVAAARRLRQGDPSREDIDLGPMARRRLRDELHAQVQASCDMGAKLVLGGELPAGAGAFYPATVLIDVTPDMPVFREETFGPVAPITVAQDREDAVRLANDSDFGLAGAIWSADEKAASRLAARVETGAIFVNGVAESDPRVPIGGVKQSGYGRELSHFGLREFCNAKLTWRR